MPRMFHNSIEMIFCKSANFKKIFGFGCNVIPGRYENLNEAKLQCTFDSGCTWIKDMDCKGKEFYFCATNNSLENDQSETSCVYTKDESSGRYCTRE